MGRRTGDEAERVFAQWLRRGLDMRTWASIAALSAMLLLAASAANAAPSALAKACAKDIKSLCGDVKPGGGKLAACMKAHFSDLSTDCQIALHQGGRGRASVQSGHEEVLRRRKARAERQGGHASSLMRPTSARVARTPWLRSERAANRNSRSGPGARKGGRRRRPARERGRREGAAINGRRSP